MRIAFYYCWVAGFGCFIGNSSVRSVDAQGTSLNVPERAINVDYPVSRFWVAAAQSTSEGSWDPAAAEIISAIVLDINEKDIVYVLEGNATPVRLPSSRLQAIDVIWASETATKAHENFLRHDYKAAIDLAKSSIAEGKLPRWQQRILAAEITDCFSNMGQSAIAGRVFISLCKESPAPMLYASAPLNWTTLRADTGLVLESQEWIKPESSAIAQLLGASWLLIGEDSMAARSVLEQLRRNKSSVISQLASAQLWRVATPLQIDEQYSDWTAKRDRMILPLQIGPTTAIAHKLERAGRAEEALQEWLRIVAIYPKNQKEIRQSQDSAIELLKQLGRIEESEILQAIQRRETPSQ